MDSEEVPVRARLGNEEDHAVEITVALLEHCLSLDGLEVDRARLGFDANRLTIEAGPTIDGAKISRDRKR